MRLRRPAHIAQWWRAHAVPPPSSTGLMNLVLGADPGPGRTTTFTPERAASRPDRTTPTARPQTTRSQTAQPQPRHPRPHDPRPHNPNHASPDRVTPGHATQASASTARETSALEGLLSPSQQTVHLRFACAQRPSPPAPIRLFIAGCDALQHLVTKNIVDRV